MYLMTLRYFWCVKCKLISLFYVVQDQVASARTSLEATIKELDNIVEGTVSVPLKHHLYFIQRRGEMLRQIGDQFGGVSISFPRNGQGRDEVSSLPPLCAVSITILLLFYFKISYYFIYLLGYCNILSITLIDQYMHSSDLRCIIFH